jgi:hypothetical protein
VSEALENRSEVLKLARLLERDPATLAYLHSVPAADLRTLREQVTERLFSAQGGALGRIAAASKLLPTGLIATISEKIFGPLLSARVAGMLEPARAVDVAAKLPSSFLADVAIDIDPRRASDVIARIPPRQIAEVAAELVRRKEYVTLGRFVGHVGPDALTAALAEMGDGDLLEVAFVLEDKQSLDAVVGLLPPGRLPGILAEAAGGGLWAEALDLLGHVSEPRRAAIAALVMDQDDGVLESLVRAVASDQLWTELRPLVAQLSAPERERAEAIAARIDPGISL